MTGTVILGRRERFRAVLLARYLHTQNRGKTWRDVITRRDFFGLRPFGVCFPRNSAIQRPASFHFQERLNTLFCQVWRAMRVNSVKLYGKIPSSWVFELVPTRSKVLQGINIVGMNQNDHIPSPYILFSNCVRLAEVH